MATLTRERLAEILAQEFERSDGYHPSQAAHIDALRQGKGGKGMEAALSAMRRAIEESKS